MNSTTNPAPDNEVFHIDDLVERANSVLSTEAFQVDDGRCAVEVTIRNVRYYQSLGLLPVVTRLHGRAAYTTAHLVALVNIKRAQANGLRLENLDRSLLVIAPPFNTGGGSTVAPATLAPSATVSPSFGWSIRIVDGVRLVGDGPLPSNTTLQHIQQLLDADPSLDTTRTTHHTSTH